MSVASSPISFDVEVPLDGRIELQLPKYAGSQVTVYIVEQSGTEFDELVSAAASSTDFWDNPQDDEDWNNA